MMTVRELREILEGQDGDLEVRVMQRDRHGCGIGTGAMGRGRVSVRRIERYDTRRLALNEITPERPRRGDEAVVLG